MADMFKRLVVAVGVLALAGCQSTRQSARVNPEQNSVPDQYQAAIDGGLGIRFNDSVLKLKELGFERITRPKKLYEVGRWNIPFFRASGFFNFGMEASTSPSTGRIYSIKGFRFYGIRKQPRHFASCNEDFTLLRTKIEAKYPSLHKRYDPGLNVAQKHSSVALHEGKGWYKYLSRPRYFGRSIYLNCSIQTSGDEVIGSMLTVTYSEDYETTKNLRAEQKRIFRDESGTRLKEKGISDKDL